MKKALINLTAIVLVLALSYGGGFAAGVVHALLRSTPVSERDILLRAMIVKAYTQRRYRLAASLTKGFVKVKLNRGRKYWDIVKRVARTK